MRNPDPHLSLDRLAQLDAGLLDAAAADRLLAAAAADPAAVAALTALAATRAELADYGAQHPVPPVPAAVASRWDTALERAAGRRAWRMRPRLLAAAAAAAVTALLGTIGLVRLLHPVDLQHPDQQRVELLAAARPVLEHPTGTGAGPLTDPQRRSACLRAVAPPGVRQDAAVLGGRAVRLGGRPGLLLVLATGELGVFDVVVVDPDCGSGGGTLLGSTRVGQ